MARSWSLRKRLRNGFALAVALATILIAAVSHIYQRGSLNRELEALCSEEIEELEAHYDARGFDEAHFQELVEELQASHSANPLAWRFWVAGRAEPIETGDLRLITHRPTTAPAPLRPKSLPQDRWHVVSEFGPDLTVECWLDGSSQKEFLRRYESFAGLLLVFVSMLAFGIGSVVAGRVSRHLSEVAKRARSVRSLDTDVILQQPDAPEEIRDVAEALEEMLGNVRAEYERNRLLIAGLAHELRSPIQNLAGETEVALLRDRAPAEYRTVLESQLEEFRGLGDAVDNLVTLCSQKDPYGPPEYEKFDLEHEARLRLQRERSFAERREVNLNITGTGELELHADREAILRAIRNLVANAVEWTAAGGKVEVLFADRGDTIEIVVDDAGPGIPPEERERVFEPFFRGRTTKGRRAGFGLGLALARTAAESHDGSLVVADSPAGGARLVLTLPRQRKKA